MRKLIVFAALALDASSSIAASVSGGSSSSYVVVGQSNILDVGTAGIAVPTAEGRIANTNYVVGLRSGYINLTDSEIAAPGISSAYVVLTGRNLAETWKSSVGSGVDVYSYRPVSDSIGAFPLFGGEVIAKVSGVEVYFGEWAPRKAGMSPDHSTDLNLTSANRTVFYAGENPTNTMPTLVNVKYDVVGIRRFDPSAPSVSTGTLTANYGGGGGTLAGSIVGGAGTVNFTGTTIATNGSFKNATGIIKGQFYGSGAEVLAGMYHTGNPATSVAFGGKKQ